MTYEKAINILNMCCIVPNNNYDVSMDDAYEVHEMCINALEKQMPKKPKDYQPMTDKQLSLIEDMNEFCREKCPLDASKSEAREYISKHIDEFKLATEIIEGGQTIA